MFVFVAKDLTISEKEHHLSNLCINDYCLVHKYKNNSKNINSTDGNFPSSSISIIINISNQYHLFMRKITTIYILLLHILMHQLQRFIFFFVHLLFLRFSLVSLSKAMSATRLSFADFSSTEISCLSSIM